MTSWRREIMGLRTPQSCSYDGSVPKQHSRERIIMARKDNDNFYRRQQEEANRLSAQQNRHLADIARHSKSAAQELRKFRHAFETFAEAMLGMKIEPFQGAVLSEAARGQVAEFDIKGFKEALLKGEALTVPGDNSHEAAKRDIISRCESLTASSIELHTRNLTCFECPTEPKGEPYPHVDISTPGKKDRVAEHVKDARAAKLDAKRAAAREDEERARREGKARTGYGDVLAIADEAPAGTVSAAIQEAIANGEHPPVLDGLDGDGLDDEDLPACGFCGDDPGLPECPTHGEVLPPGVTPKMMADHPEFAERVRRTPHYHQANQYASQRAKHEVRIAPDGTGVLPTEPGEDIPVTMNGKEIGRATVREDGTATVSIDGDKAIPTVARGGYTGIGLSENVVGGIVHQGIFSDIATADTEKRSLSQFAADAERRRRDGLASY